MELETVHTISVGHLLFESLRQVDDRNGFERTLLYAKVATDAHGFGDHLDLTCLCDLNTNLTGLVDRTGLRALESASFWLAPFRIYNSNPILIRLHDDSKFLIYDYF